MGQMGDLIGAQGAAATGVLGPAEYPGLEEGAIDDQLAAALEQIEQAYLALGSVEHVLLVHSQPRHPPAFGRQRVTGAGQCLLLHEELLARSLPLLLRHDRGCVRREMPFPCSFSLSLLVAILFLLCFMKQTETIRSENFSELADAHRQNSSRGSGSGDHYCCPCDACWGHMSLL